MLTIINPATATKITEVTTDDRASVEAKFHRARAAQPAWARTPLSERKAAIQRFADHLVVNQRTLAETLTSEMGKPIKQALGEIGSVGQRIAFFLNEVERALEPEQVFSDGSMLEQITREPLGVIANISAWNYPYFVGSNVFIPALLTGNTVLYKPSEHATLTGLAITDALHTAGIPKDVFIAVIGEGEVGAALLSQPIDGVYFTGSYATGVKINQAASPSLARVQLELGGKDPAYVCADADARKAALGLADGAFYNTGQSCCSVERIYVHRDHYDEFVASFVTEVKSYKLGDPRDESTYLGPLTRKPQLAVLSDQVADAVQKGAKVLLGGHAIPGAGYYFEPTVLTDVNHTMKLMRDESFGPIIGIQRVDSDDEALALMNDTDYGLTAAVYTPDRNTAERLLSRVHSGSVYWNCCDRVSPRLPWSGRRHSGIGSTLSVEGIRNFTQPKAWHLRSA